MDALETLVRDALTKHAADAPAADRLLARAEPARPGRRRLYAALAAAAVVAIALGVVGLAGGRSHHAAPAGTVPTFPPVPAGQNELSYHGITIQVPDSFPISERCEFSHGVYVEDPASAVKCGPQFKGPATRTLVVLRPYVADHSRGGPADVVRRDLPGPGVSIEVTAPTPARAQAILATVRVTPIDRNGCAARQPDLANPSADQLLPGTPVRAAECDYTRDPAASAPAWLLRSLPVDRDRLDRLVAAVRSLTVRPSAVYPAGAPGSQYRFTYADGSVRTIEVARGDPAAVTDGQHVALDPDNAVGGYAD